MELWRGWKLLCLTCVQLGSRLVIVARALERMFLASALALRRSLATAQKAICILVVVVFHCQ